MVEFSIIKPDTNEIVYTCENGYVLRTVAKELISEAENMNDTILIGKMLDELDTEFIIGLIESKPIGYKVIVHKNPTHLYKVKCECTISNVYNVDAESKEEAIMLANSIFRNVNADAIGYNIIETNVLEVIV